MPSHWTNVTAVHAFVRSREVELLGVMLRAGRTFAEWRELMAWRRSESYRDSDDEWRAWL